MHFTTYLALYMEDLLNLDKKQLFLHITKTGGTSLEESLKSIGVKVGIYDLPFISAFKNWHAVPGFLGLLDFVKTQRISEGILLYRKNPFDRVQSEMHCEYGGRYNGASLSHEEFNAKAVRVLLWVSMLPQRLMPRSLRIRTDEIPSFGHWTPQTKYLWRIAFLRFIGVLRIQVVSTDGLNTWLRDYNLPVEHRRKSTTEKRKFSFISKMLICCVFWQDFLLLPVVIRFLSIR